MVRVSMLLVVRDDEQMQRMEWCTLIANLMRASRDRSRRALLIALRSLCMRA
jgi:hypothetical protein